MTSIFFFLYRLIAWPLLRGAFSAAAPFAPKIRAGLEQRKGEPWLDFEAGTQPVWFHCASGEFEYAKPVITEIKRRLVTQKILVTYFSPTMAPAIKKFKDVDFACPIPWDSPLDLNKFIDHHRPRALLIARTDAWPEMVRTAKTRGIPSLLFSATLADNSGRMRGLGRWVSHSVFPLLGEVFAVTPADRKNFQQLGAHAEVGGDTRYDQVRTRLENPKAIRNELFTGPRSNEPALIAGSSWSEDEKVLVACARSMKSKVRFIFAPHEPTPSHLKELQTRLKDAGLSYTLYSRAARWEEDVLIVDQIGILAELYMKAQFAFVGGSFKKTVHSVMEPLAAGCLTFVGPLHTNNREAIEFRTVHLDEKITAVTCVNDETELENSLEDALTLSREKIASRLRDEVAKRSGASVKVAEWALRTKAP
ncbi:MAG TPA: glycosyltransferase N-terminal domain-containing protein [Bdellovibrionales bacterium]|nr:glycosyltransferase N-terminal domain-containing protein [Bdellovibrionales bacterium]